MQDKLNDEFGWNANIPISVDTIISILKTMDKNTNIILKQLFDWDCICESFLPRSC